MYNGKSAILPQAPGGHKLKGAKTHWFFEGGQMKKYMIEREIPKVGSLGPQQVREAAGKSNQALEALGSDIQWLESFVTADKTFCVYLAKDEAIIRRHADLSGFPATKITEIGGVIDPASATAK